MTLPSMARWAQENHNGVLTGRLAINPPRTLFGNVSGWRYIGNMSKEDFAVLYMQERHEGYHTAKCADWRCRHCREAGWIK